ncbi:MAG: class I SAM-dependent methyltransferase [Armatimonadota bacterium]
MESQFNLVAPHYDKLMSGVPYSFWVKYLEDLLLMVDYEPKTILDVACGTGNVSELLAEKGYEVTGFDISKEMIAVALNKDHKAEYFVSDVAELNIDRKFDLAISLFDSLNYVTDINKLREGIKRVSQHLVDNGIFIFDVNTIYALQHHFFDQANLSRDHLPRYVWRSEWDNATRICRVNMTFETENEYGELVQFKEVHVQKGYTIEELSNILRETKFKVLHIFHAYKFKKPNRRSDRVFFVARKENNEQSIL